MTEPTDEPRDPSARGRTLTPEARQYLAALTLSRRVLLPAPWPAHVHELVGLGLVAVDACEAAELTIYGRETCTASVTPAGASFYGQIRAERTRHARRSQTRMFVNPNAEVRVVPGKAYGYATIPFVVELVIDDDFAGHLEVSWMERGSLGDQCRRDVKALEARTGPRKVLRLHEADIPDPSNRGQGFGVRMYLAAVEAAGELGALLVADRCYDARTGGRGSTSEHAKRVWASKRFHEAAFVEGFVAVARPPAPSRSLAALAAWIGRDRLSRWLVEHADGVMRELSPPTAPTGDAFGRSPACGPATSGCLPARRAP